MTVQNRIKAIKKLQIKAENSFKEAKLLYSEGFYETTISRSYYTMFYLGQAVLATKDISRKKHSGVIAAFAEQFTNPGILPKMLHIKILRAFKERHVADYVFEVTKTDEEAKEILNYAEDFFKEIVPYLNNWIEENKE